MLKKRKNFLIFLIFATLFLWLQLYFIPTQFSKTGENEIPEYELISRFVDSPVKINSSLLVFVFFHIQKTSGTFLDRQILQHLKLRDGESIEWKKACKMKLINEVSDQGVLNSMRKFVCVKRSLTHTQVSVYLSENVIDWGWPVGLHPNFNDLKQFMRTKFQKLEHELQFLYITVFRDPIT
jgi:hypothetical protein